MAMWTANEIASDDCVQLGSRPQGTLLVRDVQFLTKISANPPCQFGRQQVSMRTVSVREVFFSRIHTVILNNILVRGIEYKGSKANYAGFKR
jgi:hypothetical protein